ncbi:hypothetical protein ACFVZH_33250 [Streptomyces sp. NPDC059534]|uniref:hypothetical protein n=1 Tax=Streptomyces sp. NPDC059534 TaxID=3346859 RepID=UPI0036B0A431
MKRKILALAAALGFSVAGLAATATPAQAYAIGPGDCSWSGGKTLWYSGVWLTNDTCYLTNKTKLSMQRDGNLVLYCVTWEYGQPREGRAVWATGTWNAGYAAAKMQVDGNLVVYGSDTVTPYWSSRTWGHDGAVLAIQDDSNVVIYDSRGYPIWHSNTYHAC